MTGLLLIMVCLLCIYLVFKGVEIFQIAYMTPSTHKPRWNGLVIGALFICIAIAVSIVTFTMMGQMAERISSGFGK